MSLQKWTEHQKILQFHMTNCLITWSAKFRRCWVLNLSKSFFEFWRDLEDLSKNDKLREMRNYYHKLFLSICWNTFFSFYVIYLLLWSLMGLIQQHSNAMLVPLGVLIILLIIDLCIHIKSKLIEYVFMIILIIEGFYITYESLFYQEYQFHEIWMIFYWTFLLISISCCFHWKRMIALYWFVQLWNFIMLHSTYSTINVYFYPGFIFITSLLPLVWMIIARLILAFLMMIHNNQELIKTIKKILLIFPEAILIQTVDEDSERLILQLVNDTAAKEIIKYDNPWGQSIDDNKLEYNFKLINNHKKLKYKLWWRTARRSNFIIRFTWISHR